MLENSWFKKEKPFAGFAGFGGGVGSNLVAGVSIPLELPPWYDDLDPFSDSSQVGYWKLESASARNENNTGATCSTQDGTPTFTAFGSTGAKYWNNPENSSLNCGDNPRSTYPLSFSIWCYKPTGDWSSGGNNQLLMNWSMGGQRLSICNLSWDGDGVYKWSIMYGGTNHWTFDPSSRPENEWMHIVYCIQGSNNTGHKLYQNGGSALTATNLGWSHGGSAGTAIGGNSAGSEDWNGYMYNVRLFNKLLSQSEAAQLYANDKPPGA